MYAKIYKDAASMISKDIGVNKKIWFTGDWGWRWYAKENGMEHFINNSVKYQSGDYLVVPKNVSGSNLPTGLELALIKKIVIISNLYENYSTIWFYSYFPFYKDISNKQFYTIKAKEDFEIYIIN